MPEYLVRFKNGSSRRVSAKSEHAARAQAQEYAHRQGWTTGFEGSRNQVESVERQQIGESEQAYHRRIFGRTE